VTSSAPCLPRSNVAEAPLDVVTGAFSYTGRFIARRLLADGRRVRTLTRHSDPTGELSGRVEVAPLDFRRADALTEALRGADALYNTYWIRFPHRDSTYDRAVANTRTLLDCAGRAGVRRFVQLSVTNAEASSTLPYFRGKAAVERDVSCSGLSFAIVRPTLIFGPGDILVNNIAWLLRSFPVFLVPGSGDYLVQPVSVEDTAGIAIGAGRLDDDLVLDAAGPELYPFADLVRLVVRATGARARIVHVPSGLALGLSRLIGALRRDVLLTSEELRGLTASLLVSESPPAGTQSFRAWIEAHGPALGRRYVSELERNYCYRAL